MPLERFNILKSEEDAQLEGMDHPILINTDHIVTIKPIRIMHEGNIIDGHWIRTQNGKKYRATRIPGRLKDKINDDSQLTRLSLNKDNGDRGETYFSPISDQ